MAISINDVSMYGIPSADTVVAAGDVVSIHCAVTHQGWTAATAATVGAGAMVAAAEQVVADMISVMIPGNSLGDINRARQQALGQAE